jgi:hypothetical protein
MKNNILESIMDYNVWLFLQWYYSPFMLMSKGDEIDRFLSQFSLNGIKSFGLCK